MNHFVNGLRVLFSDGGHWQPIRVHSKSANQGKVPYHRRIAKKWRKRFGLEWIETQKPGEYFILGNHSLIVRHDDWPALKEMLDVQQSGN